MPRRQTAPRCPPSRLAATIADPSVGIALESVSKRFDDAVAVDNVSLEIGEGEFFSLLGPSGCGKTTTLRMIVGFKRPDEGRILLRAKT